MDANAEWNRLQAKYGGLSIGKDVAPVQNFTQPTQKKGRSGFSKWLPTLLAAGGTIAAAPFTGGASLAGTAAILGGAAAAGGAAGEFGAQKLNKEKTDFGKIAKEGVISGATGAIPIGGVAKAAKVARGATATIPETIVTRGATGIPIKYIPSGASGVGKQETTKKALFNPTVGDVADAQSSLMKKGYKVNGKIRSTNPNQDIVAPDFTPNTASSPVPIITMTGKKTSVPLKSNEGIAQTIQAKPQPFKTSTSEVPVTPTSTARTGILGRVQGTAKNIDMESSGLKVGQSLRGGEVLTPERADELYTFAREGSKKYTKNGVKAGKPIDQAHNAQAVHNGVIESLDESLGKINRKVTPKEVENITKSLDQKLIDHPDITGKTALSDKFKELVAKKDVIGLEKLRREYDDIAYTAAGKAGNTVKAAEAKSLRDTIDEFVTPLSKDYKAIKGDYTNSKELLTLSSKGSASAKGSPIPFMNARVLPQATSGLKSKIAGKIAGDVVPKEVAQRGLVNRTLRETGKQTIGQTVAGTSPIVPEMPNPNLPELDPSQDPNLQLPPDTGSPQDNSADVQGQLDSAIQQALASGDTKGLDNLLKVADYYAAREKASATGANKPLSAEASKVIANANSGIKSLDQLESMISQGGVPKGTVLPGRTKLGGLIGNAAGTSNYDAISRNVTDVISRLRTGAALTDSEVAFYNSQVPQAFDNPETIQSKLNTLREFFSSVSSRTGSPGSDLQAALSGAQ